MNDTKNQIMILRLPLIAAALFLFVLSNVVGAGTIEEGDASVTAEAVKAVETVEAVETTLTPRQQSVITISAFTANGDGENLKKAINDGLDNGLTVNEIGEVMLQLYAYAGFPRSLNGTSMLAAVLEERQAEGKISPQGMEPDFLDEGIDKYSLGVTNLGRLMGFPYKQEKAETNGYNDAMDAFLKEHLFADIFGRNNLPFDIRELATVSALASLEGTNSQMLFHMSAAMTVGFTEEQMRDFVEVIKAEIGEEMGQNASAVLTQVLERRAGMAGGAPPAQEGYSYIPEVFPRGQKSDNPQIFTGDSWVAPLVPFDDAGGVPAVNVTFAPDARTTWHAHSYQQVLFITMGQGFYQEKGEEPRKLKAGDTVIIPAGVEHWHGSAPGEWFAHIALLVRVESDAEDLWLDPVDDEYFSGLN